MISLKLPYAAAAGGVRVAVRLSPKASRAGVAGMALDAEGRAYVALRVSAPARDGKANAALLKLLAKEWGVARSRLRIIGGEHDRRKTIHLAGDPPDLLKTLQRWTEGMSHD